MDDLIIKQKHKKDKSLISKVIYRLLEVKGIYRPCSYFGVTGYRKLMSVTQYSNKNLRLSTVRWLAEELDVPPQFIVRIAERSKKGEEGYNIERVD